MLSRIRKNDNVSIISGKDKGKEGKVLEVRPKKNKILVKGLNMVMRHQKARKQGEQNTIVKKEAYLPLSRVMPVCPSCKKTCRVRSKAIEDGAKKARACHRCNGEF